METFKSISVESMPNLNDSKPNSIISEEDSAFEDTPAANRKVKQAKMNMNI